MKNLQRSWDILSHKKRESMIRETIHYFQSEHDQEIGMIAAEDILDFFLEALSGDIYNKALEDAKLTIQQNLENTEMDLELLRKK